VGDRSDKSVPGFRYRLYKPRTSGTIADRPPYLLDALYEHVVGDGDIVPDLFKDLILRNESFAVLEQENKYLERLLSKVALLALSQDTAAPQIDLDIAKTVNLSLDHTPLITFRKNFVVFSLPKRVVQLRLHRISDLPGGFQKNMADAPRTITRKLRIRITTTRTSVDINELFGSLEHTNDTDQAIRGLEHPQFDSPADAIQIQDGDEEK